VYATQVQKAHVVLGLPGLNVLVVQGPAQGLALLETHAQLRKQRLAGIAQQAPLQTVLVADTQLKVAISVLLALDTQQLAALADTQHAKHLAFAILLQADSAVLGLPGLHALVVHAQEQERALLGLLALLQKLKPAAPGTVQQALILTVLDVLSPLKVAT
jgi:hypothetical protein